ncbi:hypothetical protein PIB30_075996 [Stylosanthes scabra]|uniref:Uncharacterized protein n=1 Tax=Stylosanthes scabra TaxID=79078 RepID=A0ABU6VNM4_9FABA|nr:hypothetical protein [Stylosanthes scabra]
MGRWGMGNPRGAGNPRGWGGKSPHGGEGGGDEERFRMYLRGFWDSRNNRICQDRRLEVYLKEVVAQEAEAVQMPHELPFIYCWVSRDVLGSPSVLSQDYLDELKLSEVIFGGRELERRYRIEAPRPGDRVCYLNLDHPRVPNWLWVNELLFTKFWVKIPFSDFQQRLLKRASIASSQLHPNAWSAIRCFELVTELLELPQEREVFLYLFTLFSPNTEGITKKRDHRSFWKSLVGDSRFRFFWSSDAGLDYVPATYQGLNADQKDTTDILVFLFSKRNLAPNENFFGNDVTLARLRCLVRPSHVGCVPSSSGPVSVGGAQAVPVKFAGKSQAVSEGGNSSNIVGATDQLVDVSSPVREEIPPLLLPKGCEWPSRVLLIQRGQGLSRGVSGFLSIRSLL